MILVEELKLCCRQVGTSMTANHLTETNGARCLSSTRFICARFVEDGLQMSFVDLGCDSIGI